MLNLGVFAYSQGQAVLALEDDGLRFHPDLVILGYVEPDLYRNVTPFFCYAKGGPTPAGPNRFTGLPVPSPGDIRATFWTRSFILETLLMVWETSTHGPPDANMVETTGSFLLDTARDLVRGAGARFILLYMPGRGDPETHDGEFVVSYAEAAGVEFVDPRPRFTAVLEQQGAAAYDALFLPDDDHPSASGYRLIAEEMAAWLAAHPDPTSQTL